LTAKVGGVRHSAPLKRAGSEEATNTGEVAKTNVESALNPLAKPEGLTDAALSLHVARPVTKADLVHSDGKAQPSTYTHPEPKHEKHANHHPHTHGTNKVINQPGGAYGGKY
jgi:hypothetical protein